VIAAFAELAGALIDAPPAAGCAQHSLTLDYLEDAPAGSALYARARRFLGNVHIEIRASDNRVLVARATLSVRGQASGASGAGDPLAQPIYPN
jgi:hypothetical protein